VAAEILFDFEFFIGGRCGLTFGIGLELYRSASRTVSKRAGAPFMKLSGKSRVIIRPLAADIRNPKMSHCNVRKRTNKSP